STVRNSVTCGAVNALRTIASAVALRTPLTGTRRSDRPAGAAADVFPLAAASTSSRVITPLAPEPVIERRSTPSVLASLRTGGLASGTWPPWRAPLRGSAWEGGSAAGGAEAVAAGAVGGPAAAGALRRRRRFVLDARGP